MDQIDTNKTIKYTRPYGGITRLHILEAIMYVFGYEIKGTYEDVHNIDDMIIAINHYNFLHKYNLE